MSSWNPNITWLANTKRVRSQSRQQSEQAPPPSHISVTKKPSLNACECITSHSPYTLNSVPLVDLEAALHYAIDSPETMKAMERCVANNFTRLCRSLHTAITSGYFHAVRMYTLIVETVMDAAVSPTPMLLTALLSEEATSTNLLMWIVEDSAKRLLGTPMEGTTLGHQTNTVEGEITAGGIPAPVVVTPHAEVLDSIQRLLQCIIVPLVSSCPSISGTNPSSHSSLEARLKALLVEKGLMQVLFNVVDYCNVWLAGCARFNTSGIRCINDPNEPTSSAFQLRDDNKLIETFRSRTTSYGGVGDGDGGMSPIVGSLLQLARTSATTLIHLLKASKDTKRIFLDVAKDSPSFLLRTVAAIYHTSDSFLQLQLCEALVRGYSFDKATCQGTTVPSDRAYLIDHCGGASNPLVAFLDVLMQGVASLPTDATLIPQCRRLLRSLEDRQRSSNERSPLKGINRKTTPPLDQPALTATFDVLRVEYGVENGGTRVDGGAATTTTSQRGGELFQWDTFPSRATTTTAGPPSHHQDAESTTVVFSPMFFLLRPPTTSQDDPNPPLPFAIPHDRITSVKLTRDKRFGFKLTPTPFESRVLAEDRAVMVQAAMGSQERDNEEEEEDTFHPSALLSQHTSPTILSNLIHTASGSCSGDGPAPSDLLRLLLYIQRCDIKARPSVYTTPHPPSNVPSSFMLYLCTTTATITAITSSNLQVWIKRAKAAYTSTQLVPDDPTPPLPPQPKPHAEEVGHPVSSSSATIGRNHALAFLSAPVGEDEEVTVSRRSSAARVSHPILLPPPPLIDNHRLPSVAPSSVAAYGDRYSRGSVASSMGSYHRASDVTTNDPPMYSDDNTPAVASLPLRGLVAAVSSEVDCVLEVSRLKDRLAVLERYKELIDARTDQYKLNHRLRRQEFEEVIVKPVFENVLNGTVVNNATISTTTNSSRGTPSSTITSFDTDLKQAVFGLNDQLESIEAVGDSIVDVIKNLRKEYGDGVDAVERRKRTNISQGGKRSRNEDDGDDDDPAIDRDMLSPIQHQAPSPQSSAGGGSKSTTVLRDIVKSMEKKALGGIKSRVEERLASLDQAMKHVIQRRNALEDPSPLIRSFAAKHHHH